MSCHCVLLIVFFQCLGKAVLHNCGPASVAQLDVPSDWLIQEGQLSVSGERMCTILVNRLED